jgi:hypothetical protein
MMNTAHRDSGLSDKPSSGPHRALRTSALSEIRQVRKSWASPHSDLAFNGPNYRILPDEYQANTLRAIERCLLIQDNLLNADELAEIQMAYSDLPGDASTRFGRQGTSPFEAIATGGSPTASQEQLARIQRAQAMVINRIWCERFAFLLAQPAEVIRADAWINDAPLHEGQQGRYHFTHYDCDEYLEFSKGLFRFPPYAAVFYIEVDHRLDGGRLWFPELEQAVKPVTNRVAVFDARYVHGVLPATAPTSAKRTVMTMNVWDYETRNERIELEQGILGFTRPRTDELEWLP